jgi:hypothetical protein
MEKKQTKKMLPKSKLPIEKQVKAIKILAQALKNHRMKEQEPQK